MFVEGVLSWLFDRDRQVSGLLLLLERK